MKRTTALAFLGLACLMATPSITQARYREGMNLYQYVRSSPVRYVDTMGRDAEDTTTVDHWQGAATAVDAHDWAAATAHMNAIAAQAREQGQRPSPDRKCCCTGADKGKCHIYVTHLAKIAILADATGGPQSYPFADAGYPAFPQRSGKPGAWPVLEGKWVIAGVVTLVQLKHDDGKDTSGCWLRGGVESIYWHDSRNKTHDASPDDFGKWFWHGHLNTSQSSNWYIDTPHSDHTILPDARDGTG